MSIQVRFFASLRERVGHTRLSIESADIATARDVWQAVSTSPLDEEMLVAINKAYASLDKAVSDGDEVAFFPPVTGG
mgnify:FL=1